MTAPWVISTVDSNRGRSRCLAMEAMVEALQSNGPMSGPDLMAVAGHDAPAVGALRLLRERRVVSRLRCGCFALIATWRPS